MNVKIGSGGPNRYLIRETDIHVRNVGGVYLSGRGGIWRLVFPIHAGWGLVELITPEQLTNKQARRLLETIPGKSGSLLALRKRLGEIAKIRLLPIAECTSGCQTLTELFFRGDPRHDLVLCARCEKKTLRGNNANALL